VCGPGYSDLVPPTLRNDAKFADTVYMADSYLFDIPTKAGDDLGFLVRDRRRCCRRCPPRHFGSGRSLVRDTTVRQAAHRIASNGKWYRADKARNKTHKDTDNFVTAFMREPG
jgi:hypothetical protein